VSQRLPDVLTRARESEPRMLAGSIGQGPPAATTVADRGGYALRRRSGSDRRRMLCRRSPAVTAARSSSAVSIRSRTCGDPSLARTGGGRSRRPRGPPTRTTGRAADDAVVVRIRPRGEPARREQLEAVVDAVDGMSRGRRVVEVLGQRPLRDVDQRLEPERHVPVHRALGSDRDRTQDVLSVDAMNQMLVATACSTTDPARGMPLSLPCATRRRTSMPERVGVSRRSGRRSARPRGQVANR